MKILITGCRGQLGTELQKQLAAEKLRPRPAAGAAAQGHHHPCGCG